MRFFFDLTDCDGQHYDATGMELPDLRAAHQVLEMTLPRLSAERALGSGSEMTLVMIVRDACDREVLEATLDWKIRPRRIDTDRRLTSQDSVETNAPQSDR